MIKNEMKDKESHYGERNEKIPKQQEMNSKPVDKK